MNINSYISALVNYGISKELFAECDKTFIINRLLAVCFVNLYSKVKKQMKYSIVENIREL